MVDWGRLTACDLPGHVWEGAKEHTQVLEAESIFVILIRSLVYRVRILLSPYVIQRRPHHDTRRSTRKVFFSTRAASRAREPLTPAVCWGRLEKMAASREKGRNTCTETPFFFLRKTSARRAVPVVGTPWLEKRTKCVLKRDSGIPKTLREQHPWAPQ